MENNKETQINLFAGNEHFLRAYEIALTGRHSIAIFCAEELQNKYKQFFIDFLNKEGAFYTRSNIAEIDKVYDLKVEIFLPQFDCIFENTKPIKTIRERIDANKDKVKNISSDIDAASKELLKNAYNKLKLCPIDIKNIIDIAKTIAVIDNKNEIKVEHIAEAIQYQHIY